MNKIKFFVAALMVLVGVSMPAAPVSAAVMQAQADIIPLDPAVTDLSALLNPGVEQIAPNGLSTRQDPGGDIDNGGNPDVYQYAWRVDTSKLCSGARITALRVITDTATAPGHDPLYDAVVLAVFNQSAIVPGVSIVTGIDGGALMPGSMPDGLVLRGGSIPVAGALDATWSTSFDPDDMIISVVHDNNVNLVPMWMQTEIQSAELTYDNSDCPSVPAGGSPAAIEQVKKDTLAQTGASILTIAAASLSVIGVSALGIHTSRRSNTSV